MNNPVETDSYGLEYGLEAGSYPVDVRSKILNARIGFGDAFLLIVLSLILTYASTRNITNYGFFAVMVLVFMIGMIKPCNIILVWITIFYNPELLTEGAFPNFKITFVMSVMICLIYGRFSLKRLMNKASIGFAVFLVWLLFSVLIAPNKPEAFGVFGVMVRCFLVLTLFMVMVATEEDMGRVLKWWAIAAALSFIPAFLHYKLGPNTWLYDIYEATRLRLIEVGSVGLDSDTVGRLTWAGNDPNGRGASLLFPFGIALAYLMCASGKSKLFWTLILATISVCILGTYSRSAYLSAGIIILLFAVFVNIKALVPVGIMGIIGIGTIFVIPTIRERIFSIGESITVSGGTGRFYYWHQALIQWTSSPLYGNGLRSFWITVRQEVHNTYLELLADTGIIGCMMFCVLMGMACLWSFRSTAYRDDIQPVFGKILGCAMIGFCAMIGTVTFFRENFLWLALAACFMLYQFNIDYHSNQLYSQSDQNES